MFIETVFFIIDYFPSIVTVTGCLLLLRKIIFYQKAEKAIGENKGQIESSRGFVDRGEEKRQRVVHLTTIQFVDKVGNFYTFIPSTLARIFVADHQKMVPVIYNPKKPRSAFIDDRITFFVTPLAILFLGLGLNFIYVFY